MAIRSAKDRWVADWVAPSSRQKDGTWIFHRVTASVTSAAHAGGQHGSTARRQQRRARPSRAGLEGRPGRGRGRGCGDHGYR